MSHTGIDLDALKSSAAELEKRYRQFQDKALALDMTRGKPCAEQLDLANGMMTILTTTDYIDADGTDCRNYGGLDGISEAKALFSDFLEVDQSEVFIGGNTSLGLMHDIVARCMSHGNADSEQPWNKLSTVKFLCPAPGYDRHFSICEHFGIEMISIDMLPSGDPDIDQIEKLVSTDDSIKGMWFVPKYSNPVGSSISDKAVDRLASMTTAAKDFRIIWDNAYSVHHLVEEGDQIKNLLRACQAAGNGQRAFIIGSTSKISFAGAGVAVLGADSQNITWFKKHATIQTIGSDKINQLRHVRFFKDLDGIKTHMKKHAQIIKPKFDKVYEILNRELSDSALAQWTTPKGGYFISLDVTDNCAKKIVAMAKDAGVVLTQAGATFPYNNDPRDRNIRIAPTLPALAEIDQAIEVLCLCIQLVTLEALTSKA